MNFKSNIYKMANQDIKTIVFPEAGYSDRVIEAVRIATRIGIIKAILIGDESALYLRHSSVANENIRIINSKTSDYTEQYAKELFEEKGGKITEAQALEIVCDPIYFSTMLVKHGIADGIVSGTEGTTTSTFEHAYNVLGGKTANTFVSCATLFIGKNRVLKNRPILIADSGMVESPTAQDLVSVAKNCVDFWKTIFFEEPKVAFLSHNNKIESKKAEKSKMQTSADLFKKAYPDVVSDGELQLDVAISNVCKNKKNIESSLNGDANILIVPDATSASLLQRAFSILMGQTSIGPISLGLKRPVSDTSRNSSVSEIVLLSAITAIQAQID